LRIRDLPKHNIAGFGNIDKDGKIMVEGNQTIFGEQFIRARGDFIKEKLEKLLQDITAQGQKLADNLNIKDLKQYKELVKSFMHEAVNKMYKLKEEAGWDRRGRHKIYTMVQTVDKELEDLTGMMIEEQKDKVAILAKIDEIRGMLIDLYS
jgi:uncharacterized protein YaaR (DUF327 family)